LAQRRRPVFRQAPTDCLHRRLGPNLSRPRKLRAPYAAHLNPTTTGAVGIVERIVVTAIAYCQVVRQAVRLSFLSPQVMSALLNAERPTMRSLSQLRKSCRFAGQT
jgi:hypothetical protein